MVLRGEAAAGGEPCCVDPSRAATGPQTLADPGSGPHMPPPGLVTLGVSPELRPGVETCACLSMCSPLSRCVLPSRRNKAKWKPMVCSRVFGKSTQNAGQARDILVFLLQCLFKNKTNRVLDIRPAGRAEELACLRTEIGILDLAAKLACF